MDSLNCTIHHRHIFNMASNYKMAYVEFQMYETKRKNFIWARTTQWLPHFRYKVNIQFKSSIQIKKQMCQWGNITLITLSLLAAIGILEIIFLKARESTTESGRMSWYNILSDEVSHILWMEILWSGPHQFPLLCWSFIALCFTTSFP